MFLRKIGFVLAFSGLLGAASGFELVSHLAHETDCCPDHPPCACADHEHHDHSPGHDSGDCEKCHKLTNGWKVTLVHALEAHGRVAVSYIGFVCTQRDAVAPAFTADLFARPPPAC